MAVSHPVEIAPRREAQHPIGALEHLRKRVLVVTTLGYIGCFAVWKIFAIIGVEIQRQYGLSDTEFGLLLGAPWVMLAYGWQGVARLWALMLLCTAAIFWLGSAEDPKQTARRAAGEPAALLKRQIEPLRRLQVWRFGLYYFFAFGGYVALTVWLPRYLIGVYSLDIRMAAAIAVAFSLPAGLLRVLGGVLSDRYGARTVMYWSFIGSLVCTFMLSYPATDYTVHGLHGELRFTIATGLPVFIIMLIVLGFFMALGKAAVFKHIPVYYPDQVGVVGGAVGAIGGLGGFVLPLAFGLMTDLADVWTSCFMLLFGIASVNLFWMHFAIRRQEWAAAPEIADFRFLPELQPTSELGGKQP